VFVLSIPDWGVSPFAASHLPDANGRDSARVAEEIDAFNGIAEKIAGRYEWNSSILPAFRAASLFAPDGLHPSGELYKYWAEELTRGITTRLAK